MHWETVVVQVAKRLKGASREQQGGIRQGYWKLQWGMSLCCYAIQNRLRLLCKQPIQCQYIRFSNHERNWLQTMVCLRGRHTWNLWGRYSAASTAVQRSKTILHISAYLWCFTGNDCFHADRIVHMHLKNMDSVDTCVLNKDTIVILSVLCCLQCHI